MDTPFDYNHFVTGQDFLSRKNEVIILTDIVKSKDNALIFAPPKTGKKSLVHQVLSSLQKPVPSLRICCISLLNIRSADHFCKLYAQKIATSLCSGTETAEDFLGKHLSFPLNTESLLTEEQMEEILSLGQRANHDGSVHLVVYIEDFHSILYFDQKEHFMENLRRIWDEEKNTCFIITGSFVNAMKQIFETSEIFRGFARKVDLTSPSRKEVTEYLKKSFLKVGRIVSQEQADELYDLVKGHPWYLWQLASDCFSQTRGYLTRQIIKESVAALISTHNVRFKENIYNLTQHQISYIQAILEEGDNFSKINLVEKYHLNSNANLFRVKEALCKKEIIVFDENNIPSIIDPVFELWLRDYYFTA